jgi:hypothetical protein
MEAFRRLIIPNLALKSSKNSARISQSVLRTSLFGEDSYARGIEGIKRSMDLLR